MAWKKKYNCTCCDYTTDIYEGKGFMGQTIKSVRCYDCNTIQPITIGGVIGKVAPSFNSLVGRLCLNCGSINIREWDGKTCPKCGSKMEYSGEKDFWD